MHISIFLSIFNQIIFDNAYILSTSHTSTYTDIFLSMNSRALLINIKSDFIYICAECPIDQFNYTGKTI